MPRNSSGSYSLYTPGNPVVTSTVISSSWANNTLADLATAVTDSLSRSGDGGMLAGLELFDGTSGAPGLTFGSELTSGLYRNAAGDFRFAVSATDVLTLAANTVGTKGTAPRFLANETDAASNEKLWDFIATGGDLLLRTRTDADAAGATAMTITRTGTVVDAITLTATAINLTGSVTLGTQASIEVESTAPIILLDETDAAANERSWLVRSSGGFFALSTATDAAPTTAVVNAMAIDRTGTAVDSIVLSTTTASLTLNATTPTLDLQGSTNPTLSLWDTSQGSDAKRWVLDLAGGSMRIRTATDAGGAGNTALTLARSGTTVSTITAAAGTSISLNAPLLAAAGIHNGTAPTGTAERIASGTYTPTLTGVTNIAATTSAVCQWMRVGNVVTVSGQIAIDPTAGAGTNSSLGVSLPIASNLTAANQLGGAGIRVGAAGGNYEPIKVSGDTANDRASFDWVAGEPTNQNTSFTFTYVVV